MDQLPALDNTWVLIVASRFLIINSVIGRFGAAYVGVVLSAV